MLATKGIDKQVTNSATRKHDDRNLKNSIDTLAFYETINNHNVNNTK